MKLEAAKRGAAPVLGSFFRLSDSFKRESAGEGVVDLMPVDSADPNVCGKRAGCEGSEPDVVLGELNGCLPNEARAAAFVAA